MMYVPYFQTHLSCSFAHIKAPRLYCARGAPTQMNLQFRRDLASTIGPKSLKTTNPDMGGMKQSVLSRQVGSPSGSGQYDFFRLEASYRKLHSAPPPKASDYRMQSSILSDFAHIQDIDIPSKKSYSDIEFSTPVSRSTKSITLTFWKSYGETFPGGRGKRKPPRDSYIPSEAFLFGEVIP